MEYKKDDLIDMLATGKVSRRRFQTYLASLGVAAVTLPMLPRSARAAAEDHPNIFTWEGWDAQGHHLEYHNKYGEYPNFSIFGDEEEAFAKIRAGAQFDVTHPCSYKVEIWRDAGILQPIDTSRLSHWDEIIPSLKEIPGMTTENGDVYFVAADWGLTSVLYRPDLVDPKYQEEETWGILWDERYKGRLSMSDSLIDGVMVAAIYGGAKDPFNMTPDEVEVTRELLRKQLPLLRYWWTSPTDLENSMAAGELVATSSWNDAFTALKLEGVNVKYMTPKEGAMTWVCGFCLMSAADPEKLEKSYDAIDAFLSPDSGVLSILDEGYGHSNMHAYELVPEQYLDRARAVQQSRGDTERGHLPGADRQRGGSSGDVRRGQGWTVRTPIDACGCRVLQPVPGHPARAGCPGGVRSWREMAQSSVGRIGRMRNPTRPPASEASLHVGLRFASPTCGGTVPAGSKSLLRGDFGAGAGTRRNGRHSPAPAPGGRSSAVVPSDAAVPRPADPESGWFLARTAPQRRRR